MLTGAQENPWWRVDLETIKEISSVKIYGRNANQDWMAGYKILVSNTPDITQAVECYAAVSGVAPPQAGHVACQASGQYLWIQTFGSGKYVQICEVEVYPPPSAVCDDSTSCDSNK
eukprot:2206372-Rhodomonas_salina.1